MNLGLVSAAQQLNGTDGGVSSDLERELAQYRDDPAQYIEDKLGWQPWAGIDGSAGQVEILDAYVQAIRQQADRDAWEAGADPATLDHWQPGQVIRNRIRIEAGHTVGKTKLASGIVNHFFDCFPPAIVYTFAPTWEQIHDLLWKEIKADRTGKGLPGRVLDLALDRSPNHFAKGRATNNAHGTGTERIQGQHGKYLLFVLDEAEGISDFVYDAIESMASGGTVVVLMLANPRTRTSRFHKQAARPDTVSFRLSCINHPNVVAGREVVPGAVRREYVETMAVEHCTIVEQHNDDDHTFELPWQPGVIYQPDSEYLFRVLGIAPANLADNTFVPVGRYEAALQREVPFGDPTRARFGVDVARFGNDLGTLYIKQGGRVWCAVRFSKLDSTEYTQRIKREALALPRSVVSLHVRVDAGGGWGSGLIDNLKRDRELRDRFSDFHVMEVHFNGTPRDGSAYADTATEMYGVMADVLQAVRIERAPNELEADLCERTYEWVTHKGVAVKRLTPKEKFRKEHGRSPDDGDGFCLAVGPDHLFRGPMRLTVI